MMQFSSLPVCGYSNAEVQNLDDEALSADAGVQSLTRRALILCNEAIPDSVGRFRSAGAWDSAARIPSPTDGETRAVKLCAYPGYVTALNSTSAARVERPKWMRDINTPQAR